MAIDRVLIKNLRCFNNIRIHICPGVNLFLGPNGAGKTTILESIDLLSRGISFRTRSKANLIQAGQSDLYIEATIRDDADVISTLSVQKSRDSESKAMLNENSLSSMAEAAQQLPTRAFHPESHKLIYGSARERCRYLDWGAFHVKHDFIVLWRQYQKTLMHRNQILKLASADSRQMMAQQDWMRQLIRLAAPLDETRAEYFSQLLPYIQSYLSRIIPDNEITIHYFRGWGDNESLAAVMEESLPGDCQKGTTQFGPHRADIDILWDGIPARRVVSRGQQKVLALILILAQIKHFVEQHQQPCVILMDDLNSELDEQNLTWILTELKQTQQQVLLTSVLPEVALREWQPSKVFHVKPEAITEVS